MVPIETPLVFLRIQRQRLREFGPMFQQLGITAVQGGAGGAFSVQSLRQDWQNALQPGRCHRRCAGFGRHERHRARAPSPITMANACWLSDIRSSISVPVDMPMSKGEILMVLVLAVPAE